LSDDSTKESSNKPQASTPNGWALYEAEAQAVREKTARLRALRLAKEAAEQANMPANKAAAAKSAASQKAAATKRTGKKLKEKPQLLSDWLNEQRSSGRTN
jgi:hypothetical protein